MFNFQQALKNSIFHGSQDSSTTQRVSFKHLCKTFGNRIKKT